MTLLDRARTLLSRRPASTEGHEDQAAQTTTSLGLMAGAEAAGAEMTPEQQIFLSQSEHGMRERLSVLLGIPHRSLAQEREKLAIEGWLGRNSAPVEQPSRIRGLLGPLAAANPLAGVLMSPALWVAAAFAVPAAGAAVQTFRLNHAKADLAQTQRDLRTAVANAHGWEERAEQYRQGLIDAANVARAAAEAQAARDAANARARAREQRRNREIANVLAHSPEPPAWRLRDDEPASDQPTAPTP